MLGCASPSMRDFMPREMEKIEAKWGCDQLKAASPTRNDGLICPKQIMLCPTIDYLPNPWVNHGESALSVILSAILGYPQFSGHPFAAATPHFVDSIHYYKPSI